MTAKRKKQKLTESPELSAILNMLEERATKISGHRWTGRRYKAIACCECGWKCRDGIYGVTCQSLHDAHLASLARAAQPEVQSRSVQRRMAAQKGEATRSAINISPIIMQQNVQAESALPAIPESQSLTFKELRRKNIARNDEKFGGLNTWTPDQWSNALAGEVGEACNLTKKISREELGVKGVISPELAARNSPGVAMLYAQLRQELGDVVAYADLLASRIGATLEECIIDKFNEVSDRIGSSIRL